MTESAAELVAEAQRVVVDDPGRAQQLAAEAEARSLAVDDRRSAARAVYVRAQAAAAAGDLAVALGLIHRARLALADVGLPVEAERTNLGLIHVLNEMGRHDEAVAVGEGILSAIPRLASHHDRATMLEIGAAAHQNLGLCHELTGRASDALREYALAETMYRELDDQQGVGEVVYDRALALISLGRVSEALSALATAVEVFSGADLRGMLAAALTTAGEAHLVLGDYGRALQELQRARRELDQIDAPWRDHGNLLATARAYLALNCFPEALDAYTEAEAWLAEHGLAADRARASWGIALAQSGLGELDAAKRALDDAASAFAFSGQSQWLAAVLTERAAIEFAGGERNRAIVSATEALRLARDAAAPLESAYAHLRLAEIGDSDALDGHLESAVSFARAAGLAPVEAVAMQAVGRARLAEGRVVDARRAFERAVERFETSRSTIAHEALLGNFLHDKAESYDGLVRCELATPGADRGERVLRACERARSRTLSDLVGGQVRRGSDSSTRRDDLGNELAAVYSELVAEQAPDRKAALQQRALVLEQRIARARLDVIDADVGRSDAVGPTGRVPVAHATVTYHCSDEQIVGVVSLPGAAPEVFEVDRTPAAIAADLERLAIQWDRCRLGHEFVARHEASLLGATRRVLVALHESLFAAVEARLGPEQAVVVLPHGVLHSVPWAALDDGTGPVVERRSVSVAPSLAVLEHCEQRSTHRRAGVAVVGVADELAPNVHAECVAVAERLVPNHASGPTDGSVVLLGDEARAEAVLAALTGKGIVHLAGHGWWRSDNPVYSALKLADRWLTAAELLECDLDGALVVLSACDSARVRVLPGDELHGLARAVLGAGAATMLACAWPADDAATWELMEAFYEASSRGESPRDAVRHAQLAARRTRPHPYFWAGFSVIGAP